LNGFPEPGFMALGICRPGVPVIIYADSPLVRILPNPVYGTPIPLQILVVAHRTYGTVNTACASQEVSISAAQYAAKILSPF
jgi:hypothetical protein